VHVAVHHTDAAEEGEKLKERVRQEFDCVELWLTEFSPIMGYSAGGEHWALHSMLRNEILAVDSGKAKQVITPVRSITELVGIGSRKTRGALWNTGKNS